MVRGDEYYMAVCNKTGGIAIYNKSLNLFYSPFSDGPVHFNTTVDGKMTIQNISQFGRSFSIVRVPYALKLLIQELQVMNVQMRIITEDNVDQLMSMSYSNNINLLLQSEVDIRTSVHYYTRKMAGNLAKDDRVKAPYEAVIDKSIEYTGKVVESPEGASYKPPEKESPPYAPYSSPYGQESPPYAPYSPYVAEGSQGSSPLRTPESEPYNPNTPPQSQPEQLFLPRTPSNTPPPLQQQELSPAVIHEFLPSSPSDTPTPLPMTIGHENIQQPQTQGPIFIITPPPAAINIEPSTILQVEEQKEEDKTTEDSESSDKKQIKVIM